MRRYSDAQRAEALALANEIGVEQAAARLDLRAGTVRQWRKRAVDTAVATAGVELVERSTMPWSQRASEMIPKLGAAASDAVEAAHDAVRAGRGRDARDLATAAGILIDKTQLLAGQATSRSESASLVAHVRDEAAIRAEIAALRQELGLDG